MLKLYERTFGLELEFADIPPMELPTGFYIDKEETITNSNGSMSKGGKNYGAEICTRPLTFTRKDLRELRRFIKKAYSAGATGLFFDGALYVGDLEYPDLIKVVEYIYREGSNVYDLFDVPEWLRVEKLSPLITYEELEKCRNKDSTTGIASVFENSSAKKYKRPVISPSLSYIKNGVLEFRCFNGTSDFRSILESINFMYQFLNAALSAGEKTVYELSRKDKTAKRVEPIMFCGEDGFSGRALTVFNKKILSGVPKDFVAYDARGGFGLVNGLDTVSPSKTLMMLEEVVGGFEPVFNDELEILNKPIYSEHGQVVRFLFAVTLSDVLSVASRLNPEQVEKEFIARLSKFDDFVSKNKKFAESLELWIKGGHLKSGTLMDMLPYEKVLCVSGKYRSSNACESYLKKHSNLDYEELKNDNQRRFKNMFKGDLLLLSRFNGFSMKKVATNGTIYLYGDKDIDGVSVKYSEENEFVEIFTGEITKDSIIEVKPCTQRLLSKYRSMFIKKVVSIEKDLFKCVAPFIVLVDGKAIGFFGMDDKQGQLFMATDFSVNNSVHRAAKLVLMCSQLKSVHRLIKRKMVMNYPRIITEVYTNKPVSSKYRGVYKLLERKKGVLVYESETGIYENEDAVKREFLKRFSK